MSFGGDLRTFDLFDLLQWIQGRRKTGVLQLVRRSTKKTLGFRERRPVRLVVERPARDDSGSGWCATG